MERPNCTTCAYWELLHRGPAEGTGEGECHRAIPTIGHELYETLFANADWPVTVVDPDGIGRVDWCGEHQDFPRYLRSLEAAPPADQAEELPGDAAAVASVFGSFPQWTEDQIRTHFLGVLDWPEERIDRAIEDYRRSRRG